MKTHWKIYILFISLSWPLLTGAQISRVENQPGYWTLGLNAGFSYQSSDVRATGQGFGYGATLAKNLYYQPGAAFSFDLRARLLAARQFGLDPFRSYDIDRNEALNGAIKLNYTSYPAQLGIDRGFVFQNHQTDLIELGLEGVLTFNQLRENTGLVLSLFGGIGLDAYLTKIDQADASGREYFQAYAGLSETAQRSKARKELRSAILDGNYETLADDFEESGKLGFMPSLGIEIGYEFTPRFSIFGGHRLTFAGTDLLDGHRWKDPNNDLYHYTNFGLRWKINPREQRELVKAPEIEVIRPLADPYRTKDPQDGFVRADVRHVRSQSDMECRLGGRDIPFNYSYGTFEAEFELRPGRNEVQIIARNNAGVVSETVVIILEETTVPPTTGGAVPSIVITDPPYPGYRVNQRDFLVRAVIGQVPSRDGVAFYLNGQHYGFDYNIANGNFSANIPLREGNNEIRISARNEAGVSEQSSSLFLEEVMPAPRVTIQQPSAEYSETESNISAFLAMTEGVSARDQITLLVNGQRLDNFLFDAASGRIEASVPLRQGNNTIEVLVNTRGGSAADRASIVLRQPQPQVPPPVVDIQTPGQPRVSTFNPAGDILARVQNVRSRNDVSVEVNGRRISNFTFNNGMVQANIPLLEGENEIRVIAYNERGSASDVVYIFRDRQVIPANPPTVYIRLPRDREETFRADIDLRAETRHVRSKSDIDLFVNGRRSYGFSFESFTGEIRANLPLEPGQNQIRIQVRNPDGAAESGVTVICRQPLPPVVRIVSPANGYRTTEGEVRVQAIAQNVNRSDQIGFFVNGQRLTRFDFSGARGEITATVGLRSGGNSIRVTAENVDGRAEDQISVTYDQLPTPVVRINRPANNSRTEQRQVVLEATVQNVESQSDIEVTVNGIRMTGFRFNVANSNLTADVTLREGNNVIQVRAVNQSGSDAASVNVIYAPLSAPTVTITEPGGASGQSATSNYTVRARTTQVKERANISVMVNGQVNGVFSWDAASGELSLPLDLREGDNQIRIQVRNSVGQAEAAVTISYQAPQPPDVRIEAPGNNQKVREDKVTLRAVITHVDSRRNIIVKVNGRYRTDFTLEGENLILEIAGLQEGENQLSISASNRYGRDFDERVVIYEPLKVAPAVVRILSVSSPVIDFNNPRYGMVTVVARIEHVENASQITLTVNGQPYAKFSFDPARQNFEANLLLEKGKNNTIIIEARNEAGAVSDRREVSF